VGVVKEQGKRNRQMARTHEDWGEILTYNLMGVNGDCEERADKSVLGIPVSYGDGVVKN